MIICHPQKGDIPALKNIWKTVFKDTDEYINLFFDKVFSLENSLVIKEAENVVSMVFYPDYEIKIGEKIGKCAYICGAATLAEFRGNGFMEALLKETEIELKNKGYLGIALIPAGEGLFNYYGKFGYNKCFCYKNLVDFQRLNFNGKIKEAKSPLEFYEIYKKASLGLNSLVLQSPKTYETVMEEYEGKVFIYENSAFMFAKEENGLVVDEIFALNKKENEALTALENYTGKKINKLSCHIGFFENSGETVYNGMFKNLETLAPLDCSYIKMVLE